jgi:hypothetical protein
VRAGTAIDETEIPPEVYVAPQSDSASVPVSTKPVTSTVQLPLVQPRATPKAPATPPSAISVVPAQATNTVVYRRKCS